MSLKDLIISTCIIGVGSIGMVTIILTTKRSTYFDIVSPSPIVFSYGRQLKKRETKFRFEVVYQDESRRSFQFGPDLYRSVQGPHHYKLLFHYVMQYQDSMKDPNFTRFIQDFICLYPQPAQRATRVEIFKRKKLVKVYDCHHS